MPELKVALQLKSLRQPLKQALRTAATLGVRSVEVDLRSQLRPEELSTTGLRQFRKMLADLNLAIVAVEFRTRRGYDSLDDLERRVTATKQAMTFAYQLGANVVVNQVGMVPDEPTGIRWETLTEVLAELGSHGQRCGAVLAAETGTEDGPALKRLLTAVPEGTIGIALNPGNLLVNGFSPLEVTTDVGSAVNYVRATDAIRDLARGRGLEVQLGRGSVDYPALLGVLEERGYRGYFTVMTQGEGDPRQRAEESISYLRSL